MSIMHKKLILAFDLMFAHFGPLNWWPGDTPFEVMVGAILTQNTNWKNVERAISNLKREKLIDPKRLYDLDPETLAELIRPAGFFRLKTERLRNYLEYYISKYKGRAELMAERPLEELRSELLSVKGIGPETADSILLYALDKPIFVIDAYTKRILSRHGLCAEDDGYDELQELFMDSLPGDVAMFNEYHGQIVQTAKQFCRKKPLCDECPLKGWNE
jgi:endonuclease III related protein